MRIDGAVVLVTGANRGLGRVLARMCVERGAARVYGGVRDPGADLPAGVVPVRLDITDPAQVSAAAETCGDVTVLVNNAGVLTNTPLVGAPDLTRARAEMDVNYFGTLAMCRAFAPVLARNGGGALVNILSIASWFTNPAMGSYSASKAAAWAMTKGVRDELRPQGTLVVAVHSGYIDTDMARGVTSTKNSPEDVAARTLDGLAADRTEVLADDRTQRAKRAVAADPVPEPRPVAETPVPEPRPVAGDTASEPPTATGNPPAAEDAAPEMPTAIRNPPAGGNPPGARDAAPGTRTGDVAAETRRATDAELGAALRVWRAANEARGKVPDAERIARVRRKLADPAALPVVAVADGAVVGMALAEPGRADDGAGPVLPDLWHVSMVFVDPAYRGRRIGVLLLDEVAARAGGRRLQLWTGAGNERAQRLYRRAGFTPTGRVREHGGETILHLERRPKRS
ncbi:SDR family oxidoreductase [Actinocatenispora rupis]|uniref:N-acetyltransferase domain-containing protein n=1 Tax=Actinocatenispora rupis TaxID=519421 RepID=A0A8J3IWL3_9ACTN|nr:SDR family oxidoreductase [Actinocatenispora rupis]GID09960.1 hypothetical protein Aru02nite_08490 [Actinocatenispora rupis]